MNIRTILVLAVAFAMFAAVGLRQATPSSASGARESLAIPPDGSPARVGYELFLRNCAHCHGADARGDEGPDLYGLTKSDQRLIRIIQNGIKGEMPKFGAKLNDADTRAIVAFIRSLKD